MEFCYSVLIPFFLFLIGLLAPIGSPNLFQIDLLSSSRPDVSAVLVFFDMYYVRLMHAAVFSLLPVIRKPQSLWDLDLNMG